MLEISDIVTLDKRNDKTWGLGISDLLVLIGNEMDSFFRDMSECPNLSALVSQPKEELSITEYKKIYEPYYELSKNQVQFSYGFGKDAVLDPFKDFSTQTTPIWWHAINHTKHNFYTSMEEANIENILNALAGLFTLNALHLCSSFFLGWNGDLDFGVYNEMPSQAVNELLKSKTGVSMAGRRTTIETDLFFYTYRVDEAGAPFSPPLLLNLKRSDRSVLARPSILCTPPE